MFTFLCKSINSSTRNLEFLKLYSTSLRKKAEKSRLVQNGNQESFTVKYLMNQCGFSMERAVFASSKYVNFDKPDQPDSVITFLKNQGFIDSQIKKMVIAYPRVLCAKPETTLLPKIQFFRSKGFSVEDVARIITFVPDSFKRSLENCIVPSFNFIQDFLGSEKYAILAISRCARMLLQLEPLVKPNIQILLDAGMSRTAIGRMMKREPRIFVYGLHLVKESVKQVQNMGMDPLSCSYGLAIEILTVTRKSTWDRRMEAYNRWGCSEEDVLRSFKIFPQIMEISEERFNGIMSLFVHEIGFEASEVVKSYFMFTRSLSKTLIPRWSVYQHLLSKGLVKEKVNMHGLFKMKEDLFLEKFVNFHKNEAPLLLKLYTEKQASK